MASYDSSNEFAGKVINFADGTSLDVIDSEDIFKDLATTMSKEDLTAIRHIVNLIEETSSTCIKEGKGTLIPFIGEISIDARSLSQKRAAKTDAEMKALGLSASEVRAKTIANFTNSSHTAYAKINVARKMRTFYRLGIKICTVWWDGAQYDGNEYEYRDPDANVL